MDDGNPCMPGSIVPLFNNQSTGAFAYIAWLHVHLANGDELIHCRERPFLPNSSKLERVLGKGNWVACFCLRPNYRLSAIAFFLCPDFFCHSLGVVGWGGVGVGWGMLAFM